MNKQEIYDKVYNHLLKQGCAAIEDCYCRYRTSSGNMCAIGCMIPDEMYDSKMEGDDIRMVLENFENVSNFFKVESSDDVKFLKELQRAHDFELDVYGIEGWKRAMRRIALRYNLEFKG